MCNKVTQIPIDRNAIAGILAGNKSFPPNVCKLYVPDLFNVVKPF